MQPKSDTFKTASWVLATRERFIDARKRLLNSIKELRAVGL
ncbi:MAG: hypothetical protein ACYC2U_00565 [Candidatus Amoebophilus sp.]